ncbi:unknown protein [Seminavis robusta]|uniref:Uncharacterized protein n=1 Tax=Seminavis robusta TaxID=568900 RepID=A0A9N8DQQ8_9STRA|nr:unknown protein [Seminavis robusta]|eukprot:Sro284_g108000.1 n/a (408) ;mRNA; f:75514-76737
MAWVAVRKNKTSPTKSPPKKRRDTKPTLDFCRSAGRSFFAKNNQDSELMNDGDLSSSEDHDATTSKPGAQKGGKGTSKNKVRFSNGSSAADAIDVDALLDGQPQEEKKPAAKKTGGGPGKCRKKRESTPFFTKKKPPPFASIPLPSSSGSDSDTDSSDDSSLDEIYKELAKKKTVQRKRRTTKNRGAPSRSKKKPGKKSDDTPEKWKDRKQRAKERHEERKEERKKKKAEAKDEEIEESITPPMTGVKPKYWKSSSDWEQGARLRNWKSASTTYSRMNGFPGAKAIQTVLETAADESGKAQLRGYRVSSPTLAPADKASRDAIVKAATTVILKLAKASIIRMFRDDPSLIYYFVDVSAAGVRNTDRPPSPVHNAIAATMGAIMDMFDPDEENKGEEKDKKSGKGGKK